jgi:hypothetical protein
MPHIPGESPWLTAGRRAIAGETEAALSAEYGVDARTVRRWKAKAAKLLADRTPDRADTPDTAQDMPQDIRADTSRARARTPSPIRDGLRAAMAGLTRVMAHDAGVMERRADKSRGRDVVLSDAEHARAMAASAKTLAQLARAAPEVVAATGEEMEAMMQIAAEPDAIRRLQLMRDYALSWGRVETAVRAEEAAARLATGGDALRIVLTDEAAAAVDAMDD